MKDFVSGGWVGNRISLTLAVFIVGRQGWDKRNGGQGRGQVFRTTKAPRHKEGGCWTANGGAGQGGEYQVLSAEG
jgi:hypothetical protein